MITTAPPTRPAVTALHDLEPNGGRTWRARRRAPESGTAGRASGGPTFAELHRLVHRVLEVLDGRRPVTHIEGYFAPDGLRALRLRLAIRPGTRSGHRLQHLHLSRPAARSIEICATVRRGERLLAAAGHIAVGEDGWRCTSLRLL